MEVIIYTFFDAVATVDVLTASNNDVNFVETQQEDWNHYSNAKCRAANIIKRSKRSFFVNKLTKLKEISKVFGMP